MYREEARATFSPLRGGCADDLDRGRERGPGSHFTTLAAAVAQAAPGDIVIVRRVAGAAPYPCRGASCSACLGLGKAAALDRLLPDWHEAW